MSANKASNPTFVKKVAFVFFGPPTPPDLRRIRKMPTPPVPMYGVIIKILNPHQQREIQLASSKLYLNGGALCMRIGGAEVSGMRDLIDGGNAIRP